MRQKKFTRRTQDKLRKKEQKIRKVGWEGNKKLKMVGKEGMII